MNLVRRFGELWARNQENIGGIPASDDPNGGEGVYILFDGSMPVYVGKGKIYERILRAAKIETKSPFWDRFSWYVLNEPKLIHDTEVLILRMLPPCLRSLTKQGGHFQGKHGHGERQLNEVAVPISRKLTKRKRKPS